MEWNKVQMFGKPLVLALLSLSAGALLAPLGVAWLVQTTHSGDAAASLLCLPPEADAALSTRYLAWLEMLLTPGGKSDACELQLSLLAGVGQSLGRVLEALGLALLLALLSWSRRLPLLLRRPLALPTVRTVWLAPTFVWATVLAVGWNWTLLKLPGLEQLRSPAWFFPEATPPLKEVAAVLALGLGSGTFWTLYAGLCEDTQRLLQDELVLSARANGLSLYRPLLRNLYSPLLTRLSGRLPLLVGELIVVELIFGLDGLGRQLKAAAELGDGSALMTLTLGMVLATLGLRALAQLTTTWLHPATQEREG